MTVLYKGAVGPGTADDGSRLAAPSRSTCAGSGRDRLYYGFWYTPKMDALMSFIKTAQEPVTGEVTLALYKGNLDVDSRTSANSLYDEAIATMEGGGSYNQTDAEGFLRIQGLPSRVQARVRPRM